MACGVKSKGLSLVGQVHSCLSTILSYAPHTAWVLPTETSVVFHTHCSFTCSLRLAHFQQASWPIKILPVLNSSLPYTDTTVPRSFCKAHRITVFTHKNYRTGSNLHVLPGSVIFVFTCSTLNIACITLSQYLCEMKEKELLYISVHSMNISGNLKKLIFLNPTGKMTPLDTENCHHLVTSNLWGSPRTTGAVPNKISHDKGMRPFLHSFSQASRGKR